MVAACPLAFGEVGVKRRIKSVLNYKKPAFLIVIGTVVVCVLTAVCFLTNPKSTNLYVEIESDAQIVTIKSENVSYEVTSEAAINYVLEFLGDIKVSRNPISKNRSEDREKSNAITIQYGNTNVSYYFSKDCSTVWVDDEVKPSLTKRVHNSEIVIQFFASRIESPVANVGGIDETENITTEAIADLKEKYPQYFNLDATEGLAVYAWQLAADSYSCVLVSGKNRTDSWYDIWNLPATTIDEMREIVKYYNLEESDVSTSEIPNPISSYFHEINEDSISKFREKFWLSY
ncbi:MAG: hypothetical protein IJ439_02325 [Tyzzerella sp.]|nr:hypothetical protein [Tyzzerella sp.]